MWKIILPIGIFSLMIGGLFVVLLPEATTDEKAASAEKLDIPEDWKKLPVVDWNVMYKYNFEKRQGPEELAKLDNQLARIPGYIVPLVDNVKEIKEFLVVPDPQSCIHVPPPPPNLIIASELAQTLSILKVPQPAWIIGRFKISASKSKYGEAAFKMEQARLERYNE